MPNKKKIKILYIINHASFFVSHRMKLYLLVKKIINAKTFLIIGQAGSQKMEQNALKILKKNKVNYFKSTFTSSKKKILKNMLGLLQILNFSKNYKPDIIHSASPKANFFSGIIFLLLNIKACVCSISGMGYLFTNNNLSISERFLKYIYIKFLFFLKKKNNIFFILQNKFDLKKFENIVGKDKTILIPSSGIDLTKFRFKKKHLKIVVLPSRILYDKGVEEFVNAAIILKKKYNDWSFKIIGTDDYDNPSAIPKSKILEWVNKGFIIWEEYKSNPKFIYQEASIVCLPSHREGFSKVILEAGAASLPIVASNIPGCKEGIINGKTGLLFKLKNSTDLSKKIEILIKNRNLRKKMGIKANDFIKKNYEINKINKKIISVYKEILNEKKKININSA